MSIKEIEGNIWNTKCQVIVNTVNCEGIMGAGMALEARLRYPEMYKKYKEICQNKQLDIGKLWIYKSTEHNHWIMNFPTKTYWRSPSKEEYIHAGLKKFLATYKEKSITSIAFPILGGMNGGLDANKVRSIMKEYLTTAENLVVEIYEYNPNISDNFFQDFKNRLINTNIENLKKETKIRKDILGKLVTAVSGNEEICQVSQLLKIKGVGDTTLEKIFEYYGKNRSTSVQSTLAI